MYLMLQARFKPFVAFKHLQSFKMTRNMQKKHAKNNGVSGFIFSFPRTGLSTDVRNFSIASAMSRALFSFTVLTVQGSIVDRPFRLLHIL